MLNILVIDLIIQLLSVIEKNIKKTKSKVLAVNTFLICPWLKWGAEKKCSTVVALGKGCIIVLRGGLACLNVYFFRCCITSSMYKLTLLLLHHQICHAIIIFKAEYVLRVCKLLDGLIVAELSVTQCTFI